MSNNYSLKIKIKIKILDKSLYYLLCYQKKKNKFMLYFPIRLFIKILFAQNSRIYHSVIISIHTICKLHKLRRRISFILMQLFVYQNGSYIALTITRNAGKATGFSFEKSEYCHLMHCFVDLIFKFPFEFHILRIPGLGLMALE